MDIEFSSPQDIKLYQGTCGDIAISGTGTIVVAVGNDASSGIGGGQSVTSGDIFISGGSVFAYGGNGGAGIGTGGDGTCGVIMITGGFIRAMGGKESAGIGSGMGYTTGCYDSINISSGITKVEAQNGKKDTYNAADASIGRGYVPNANTSVFGPVTIDGVVITDDEGKANREIVGKDTDMDSHHRG